MATVVKRLPISLVGELPWVFWRSFVGSSRERNQHIPPEKKVRKIIDTSQKCQLFVKGKGYVMHGNMFFKKPPLGDMKVKFLGLKLNLVPPFPFDGGFMGRGMRRPES